MTAVGSCAHPDAATSSVRAIVASIRLSTHRNPVAMGLLLETEPSPSKRHVVIRRNLHLSCHSHPVAERKRERLRCPIAACSCIATRQRGVRRRQTLRAFWADEMGQSAFLAREPGRCRIHPTTQTILSAFCTPGGDVSTRGEGPI